MYIVNIDICFGSIVSSIELAASFVDCLIYDM